MFEKGDFVEFDIEFLSQHGSEEAEELIKLYSGKIYKIIDKIDCLDAYALEGISNTRYYASIILRKADDSVNMLHKFIKEVSYGF